MTARSFFQSRPSGWLTGRYWATWVAVGSSVLVAVLAWSAPVVVAWGHAAVCAIGVLLAAVSLWANRLIRQVLVERAAAGRPPAG